MSDNYIGNDQESQSRIEVSATVNGTVPKNVDLSQLSSSERKKVVERMLLERDRAKINEGVQIQKDRTQRDANYARAASVNELGINWDNYIEYLNERFAFIAEPPNYGKLLKFYQDEKGNAQITVVHPHAAIDDFKTYKLITRSGKEHNPFALWWEHKDRRRIKGFNFYPEGVEVPEGYENLWLGFNREHPATSCDLYLAHIRDVIADGSSEVNKFLLDWMAWAVQFPSERQGVALVLRGIKGAGKSLFVTYFGKLFGSSFYRVYNSESLTGRFNKSFQGKLVVFADEAHWAGNKQSEGALNALVTEDVLNIEPKGLEKYEVNNYVHLILASNKDWVAPATSDERRWCVLDVPDVVVGNDGYFGAILKEMNTGGREALLDFLLAREVGNVNLKKFPRTIALLDQILQTDLFMQWLYRLLQEGEIHYHDLYENLEIDWRTTPATVYSTSFYERYRRYVVDELNLGRLLLDDGRFGKRLKHLCKRAIDDRQRSRIDGNKLKSLWHLPVLGEFRELFAREVNIDNIPWKDI